MLRKRGHNLLLIGLRTFCFYLQTIPSLAISLRWMWSACNQPTKQPNDPACPMLSWLWEKQCQYWSNQTVSSTPFYIIPGELLMVGDLQQLPSAQPTPQATSLVLHEIRKKT